MLKYFLTLLLFVFLGCGEDPQPTKPNIIIATQKLAFSTESEVTGSAKNAFGGVYNDLFTIQIFVDSLTSPTKSVANRNMQIVFDTDSPVTNVALSGQPSDCKVSIQLFKGTNGEYDLLKGSVKILSLPTSEGQNFLVDLDLDFYGSSLKTTATVSYGSLDPLYPVTASQQADFCN